MKAHTRILALDHGNVRLGLAICDPERRIASPYANYTRRDREQDARYLSKVLEEEEIGLIVMGLPVHLNGTDSAQAQKVRAFVRWLSTWTNVPCVYFDERFTSKEAESALWDAGLTHQQRKARRDQLAAQILLQAYLEAGCPMDATIGPLEG